MKSKKETKLLTKIFTREIKRLKTTRRKYLSLIKEYKADPTIW